MDERLRFVARLLDGEKMAALCRESRRCLENLVSLSPLRPPTLHRAYSAALNPRTP